MELKNCLPFAEYKNIMILRAYFFSYLKGRSNKCFKNTLS